MLAAGVAEGKWLLGALMPTPVASPAPLHCFHLQRSGEGALLSKNMFAQPLLPCLASPTMVLLGVVANMDGQSVLLDEKNQHHSSTPQQLRQEQFILLQGGAEVCCSMTQSLLCYTPTTVSALRGQGRGADTYPRKDKTQKDCFQLVGAKAVSKLICFQSADYCS